MSKGCYSISCSTPLPNHLFPGCTTLSKVLQDRIDNGPHLSDGMQSPSMHHSTEQCQSFPSHKHTIHHTIHKKRVGILQAPSPSLSLSFFFFFFFFFLVAAAVVVVFIFPPFPSLLFYVYTLLIPACAHSLFSTPHFLT